MVSGVVEADSEASALSLVKDKGLNPVSIAERKLAPWQVNLDFLQRVKVKDTVIMARQLSVMVDASVPLVEALRILIKQTVNPKLKSIISDIADDVEGGNRLSVAFGKYPKVFTNFFISIIKSGETSGQLAEVLNYLADQLEKDYDLQSKIKGAMIYPAFIMSSMAVVGTMMMIFVVPKMTAMLEETGAELPIATKILMFISDFLVGYWWLVIILGVGAVVAFRMALKYSPEFRYGYDWFKLRIPVLGKLSQRIYVVQMTQSLSTLSAGKVPMVEALDIIADVVNNEVYRKIIRETRDEVNDGNPLASVFVQKKEMPNMLSQMISVGEETGRLDDILERLTKFYTREIDTLVANLVTLLEPIVMVLMGIAVGIMVAAIIMPIYTLSTGT